MDLKYYFLMSYVNIFMCQRTSLYVLCQNKLLMLMFLSNGYVRTMLKLDAIACQNILLYYKPYVV